MGVDHEDNTNLEAAEDDENHQAPSQVDHPSSCCQKNPAKQSSAENAGVVNPGFVDVDKLHAQRAKAEAEEEEQQVVQLLESAIMSKRTENLEAGQHQVTLDLQVLGPCQCERVGNQCQCKLSSAPNGSSPAQPTVRFESWGRWKCWALSVMVALTCIWLVVYFSLHYNNLL